MLDVTEHIYYQLCTAMFKLNNFIFVVRALSGLWKRIFIPVSRRLSAVEVCKR